MLTLCTSGVIKYLKVCDFYVNFPGFVQQCVVCYKACFFKSQRIRYVQIIFNYQFLIYD